MNRYLFGIRNITDKLHKAVREPTTLKFYFQSYVLGKLRDTDVDTALRYIIPVLMVIPFFHFMIIAAQKAVLKKKDSLES